MSHLTWKAEHVYLLHVFHCARVVPLAKAHGSQPHRPVLLSSTFKKVMAASLVSHLCDELQVPLQTHQFGCLFLTSQVCALMADDPSLASLQVDLSNAFGRLKSSKVWDAVVTYGLPMQGGVYRHRYARVPVYHPHAADPCL